MMGSLWSTILAWLLTYAIHSTALLSAAWLVTRSRRVGPSSADLLWKLALVGGIITATLQLQLDLRPHGTISLPIPASITSHDPRALEPTATQPQQIKRVESAAPAVRPRSNEFVSVPASVPSPAQSLPAQNVVVLAWAALAMSLVLVYVGRRLILIGRLGNRQPVADGPLTSMLRELREQAGYRGAVRLTVAQSISSPVALSWGEICVPEAALTELDCDQQRGLLAHELAHLSRLDPLWLTTASLLERIFFFQPLNRVARREIVIAAEYLSDEWAVRKTGSALPLARCLAKVAEWVQASPLGVTVAGMAEERSQLVSRVTRLLQSGAERHMGNHRMFAALAVVVLLCTTVMAPGVSGQIGNRANEPTPRTSDTAREDESIIDALAARLGDSEVDVRRAAARSLGNIGDSRAVPKLVTALEDSEPTVRGAVAEALSEFADPRAIAPLTELLADPSEDVKQNALNALSNFDRGVPVAPIVRTLTDSNPDVRADAARLLGEIGDSSVTKALTPLTGDPSPQVRAAVAEALGEIGASSATPSLLKMLSDEDSDVRSQALDALQEVHGRIEPDVLIRMMQDPNAEVRRRAADIAGDREIATAIPALERLREDPNAKVREKAIDALSDIEDATRGDRK